MTSLIKPRPQETFTKYERRCPFHQKARCGRFFCRHPIREDKNIRCNRYNCPFFREAQELMGKRKNKKSDYSRSRRYRRIQLD